MENAFTAELEKYLACLHESEKAPGMVEKYLRDVHAFLR